ncbi:hypothetical protein VTJ04DRAFT_6125 [Mycothermus thermophilus]|uniref:uncharacterized protein n=1 Tax=Humicola insolens TaxID=85995 RepID=UPI0037434866
MCLSFAILLGLTAGFSVGLLTLLILRLLRAIFPFLRPQEGQQQRQRQRFTIGRQKANHRQIPSLPFTTTPRTPPELLAIMQEDFPVPYDSTSSSPSTPSEHDYDADAGTATTTTTTTTIGTIKRLRTSPKSSPSPSTASSSQPSHPRQHHRQQKQQKQQQQQRPSLSSRRRWSTGVAGRAGLLVEDTIHEESSDY